MLPLLCIVEDIVILLLQLVLLLELLFYVLMSFLIFLVGAQKVTLA